MEDHQKTHSQLISELTELRQHLNNLQAGQSQQKEQVNQVIEQTEGLDYHKLFERMNTAILIIDPETEAIVDANPAACKFYGYSREELLKLGLAVIDTLAPGQIKIELARIIKNEKNYSHSRHRLANGEIRDVEINSNQVQVGDKQLLISVIHDDTERKKAEEALENERRLIRTVIDNIPDQIFAHDRDCRFILNNMSDARVIGVSDPAVLLGKSDLDFYPPELAARFQKDDRHVMNTNQPLSIHGEPSRAADGEQRWVSTIKVPLHDNQGRVIGLVGVARDITQRKLAEDELFRSRQMLQLVVDNIPLLTCWKDKQLTYLGCNQLFAREAGLSSPAEVIGKTDNDLAWKEIADQYRQDDQSIVEKDTPRLGHEEMLTRRDGSLIWVRTNKIPLHDQEGKVIGILGTSEDITAQKQAEQKIEKANEKLISWVGDLERRNLEANIIRQMSGLLQVSNERDEYYQIIKEYVPRLFPNTSGALFILNNPQSIIDAVASWGDDLQSESSFAPAECWAFRLGQIHKRDLSNSGLICRHIKESFSGNYLEVPIKSSGEKIGVLHIETSEKEASLDNIQVIAITLADHLSLSLTNLKLRETLRSQSIRDPLTGLYNRRYMEESLGRELPRAIRKKTPVGIIMMDIDHFKVFNDTYGHEAGDLVLRELGSLIQNHIRSEDIACRFGGEEFLLILPEANQEFTVKRAENIRELVKSMRIKYHRRFLGTITVSLGVAIFPEHSSTGEGILHKADEALYQAKREGRDRVVIVQEI
ncbi:MAG: diguanylate cyclase [Anaerolineaceae bacterium]